MVIIMAEFIITTDSNSDIPKAYQDEKAIIVIPQYYAFGETVYGDELQLTPAEFYAKMREGALPTSMANNPAVIRDKFEEVLRMGKDILHIAFSSELSGSYQNVAVTAGELLEEYPERRIEVIDSRSVSLGETILITEACDRKEKGQDLDTTAAAIRESAEHIHIRFTVDDLHHLQRGGRVSKAAAAIGSVIQMKPILYVNTEGKLVSHSMVRGRKKSLSTIVEHMLQNLEENYDKSRPVGIVHGDCPEDAGLVAQQVGEKAGFNNIIINDVSPSIGAHAGPGALGLCFYGKRKE